MKKKKEVKEKSLIDQITDEAVKEFKEGKIKNSLDVENFIDGLLQPIMQKLLEAELSQHLDKDKYERIENNDNNRNGHVEAKEVETKYGSITIQTPRDRKGTFQPIIIEKGQTKLTGFEDKIVSLYAKGMSTRDIAQIINEAYGTKLTKDQVVKFVSVVNEETEKWRNRPLEELYIFTYADCLYVPIKDDLTSKKKAVYVIIGVNKDGYKDVLGMWIDYTESASFWTGVFEDLKSRGVKDILYMSSDGIAGFKNSLETVFPKTQAQRCVVHLTRNIYKICPRKDAKSIISGWKKIYSSSSYDIAKLELEHFKEEFSKHTKVIKKVEDFMQYIEPLFELPAEIRKAIYTSNAVESVNSALRKVTNGKGAFPNEESVYKVLFLRIRDLKEKWKKPIPNFKIIQSQLIEIFGDRYTKLLDL